MLFLGTALAPVGAETDPAASAPPPAAQSSDKPAAATAPAPEKKPDAAPAAAETKPTPATSDAKPGDQPTTAATPAAPPAPGSQPSDAKPGDPVPAAASGSASDSASVPQGEATKPVQSSASALLPKDLSPYGMFMSADVVVKAVMIGLAFASLVTWTILLVKVLELGAARSRAKAGLDTLATAETLTEAVGSLRAQKAPVTRLAQAALAEEERSAGLPADGVKERAAALLARIEARTGRAMQRGTGLLATIGSTAPFVGLFGTVWGIMNSFIGISKTNTTNLAVVAPGIAEALLATAFGLVAAIPAVIIYNIFARGITGYRSLLGDASTEALRLLSRDLDRRDTHGRGSIGRRAAAE